MLMQGSFPIHSSIIPLFVAQMLTLFQELRSFCPNQMIKKEEMIFSIPVDAVVSGTHGGIAGTKPQGYVV